MPLIPWHHRCGLEWRFLRLGRKVVEAEVFQWREVKGAGYLKRRRIAIAPTLREALAAAKLKLKIKGKGKMAGDPARYPRKT